MVYLAPALVEVLDLPEYGPVSEFANVVHPDDRPHHTRMISALYKGEIPRLDIEFRYRGREGTWRWARQHGIVVRDADGRARRMVGVTGDITETRQRERQLDTAKAEAAAAYRDVEQTREMLQTIIDNMTDGVSLFDKDMRWLFSNRPHMQTMGYTPDTIRPGMPIEEMIRLHASRGEYGSPQDVEALVREAVERVCAPGGTRYERRMQNGRYIEFNFKPVSDGGLLGVYRDITELKEREEALAASKEAAEASRADLEKAGAVLQTVLDNMSDGVMLLDRDLNIRFANQRLMEFQRYTPEIAHEGSPIAQVLRFQARRGDFGQAGDPDRLVEQRLAMIRNPGGIHYERRAASGQYLEITFRQLSDGSVLAVNRDITELKEREEAIAAAKEAAEAARDDVEHTRQIMQTVLDNMIGGVMLFDKDFRLQFANRQVMEFQNYPPDVIRPGITGEDILRFH